MDRRVKHGDDNGAGVVIEPAAGGLFTIPTQQPFPLLIAVDRQA
jgi:hypothetical protein